MGPTFNNDYKSSPFRLLTTAFPDYNWLPWKFEHSPCPRSFWNDVKNQRNFMDWAAIELNVKQMSDWYSITVPVQIKQLFSCVYK